MAFFFSEVIRSTYEVVTVLRGKLVTPLLQNKGHHTYYICYLFISCNKTEANNSMFV